MYRGLFISTTAALLLLTSACGQNPAASSKQAADLKQFFENSKRRNATDREASYVAKLDGCASFFVENDAERTYMATARHCVEFDIRRWCYDDGAVEDNDGNPGECVEVIAADEKHDIALFEASFNFRPRDARALKLAAYAPEKDTELKMIGYPGDRYRDGDLTTTHNCWVLQSSVESPYVDTYNLVDRSSLHNCSTYGGNSGGPIIAKETDHALGLPFTYAPGDYEERAPEEKATAAHLAQMADFVDTHRAELEDAQVTIVESQ